MNFYCAFIEIDTVVEIIIESMEEDDDEEEF